MCRLSNADTINPVCIQDSYLVNTAGTVLIVKLVICLSLSTISDNFADEMRPLE